MNRLLNFFLLILILPGSFIFPAGAQERNRVELPVPAESNAYQVVPLGEKGVALISKPAKKKYRVQKLNTNLEEEWSTEGDIHSNLDFVASTFDGNSIYLLFNRYRSTEYQVVKVNAGPGFSENFIFQTIDRFLITDFKTLGYSAFMAGTIRDEPVLIFSDLQTGKSKVLPISTKGVISIQSMEVDIPHQLVNVSLVVKHNRTIRIVARSYNDLGELVTEVGAEPKDDLALLNGRIQHLSESEILLIGTYGYSNRQSSNSTTSQGLYISKFIDGQEQFTEYHSFTDFKHFFDYMSDRQLEKMERKIQKKKDEGEDLKLNYRLLVHDIIPSDNQYLVVAEVFYPDYKYNNNLYGSRSYWGNPWLMGSPFGYGLYNPYYFNPYYGMGGYYGRSNQILDGFVYTHAIVAGIDFSGKLKWDNSIVFDNVKSSELREKVSVMHHANGETQIVYGNKGTVWTKLVRGDQVLQEPRSIVLPTEMEGDKIRSSSSEEVCHWFGPYYLAWGQQRISNPHSGEVSTRGRRNVFYINKIKFQ